MDGGVKAPNPVLKVDAASWYFVKGYQDAPKVCGFQIPAPPEKQEAVEKCLETAMASWKLPPGWVIDEVPRGSDLLEEYRMAYLHMGGLYSAIRHDTFLPRALYPQAVEMAKRNLSNRKQQISEQQLQGAYDRLMGEIHTLEVQYAKSSWTLIRSNFNSTPDEKNLERIEKKHLEEEENVARKKRELWLLLISAIEQKVPIIYVSEKDH